MKHATASFIIGLIILGLLWSVSAEGKKDLCNVNSGRSCVHCLSGQYMEKNFDCAYCPETKMCFNQTTTTSQICFSNSTVKNTASSGGIIKDYEQCPTVNQCILQKFSFSPFACQVPAIIGFNIMCMATVVFVIEILLAWRLEKNIQKRTKHASFVHGEVEAEDQNIAFCTRCGHFLYKQELMTDARLNPTSRLDFDPETNQIIVNYASNEQDMYKCNLCRTVENLERDLTAYSVYLPIAWIFWLFCFESSGFVVFFTCGFTMYLMILSFMHITMGFRDKMFLSFLTIGGDIELKYLDQHSNSLLVDSVQSTKFRQKISYEMKVNEKLLWAEETSYLETANVKGLLIGLQCFMALLFIMCVAYAIFIQWSPNSRLVLAISTYLLIATAFVLRQLFKKRAHVITNTRFLSLSFTPFNTILAAVVPLEQIQDVDLSSLQNSFAFGTLDIFPPLTDVEMSTLKELHQERDFIGNINDKSVSVITRKSKRALLSLSPVKDTVGLTKTLVDKLKFEHRPEPDREESYRKLTKWGNFIIVALALIVSGLYAALFIFAGLENIVVLFLGGFLLLMVSFIGFWFYLSFVQSFIKFKYFNPSVGERKIKKKSNVDAKISALELDLSQQLMDM